MCLHRRRRLATIALSILAVLGFACLPQVAYAVAPVPGPGPAYQPDGFDLQAHRGGRGEHTEESLRGFEAALRLGVRTLELDIVLTRDLAPIIWHDPTISAEKCRDTRPATPGDRQFPYVGKVVHDLTFAQIATLRCDKKLVDFPEATPIAGNRIAGLPDLFALTRRLGATRIGYNIETKIEAEKRWQSATPEQFVAVIGGVVRAASAAQGSPIRATLQSFDWRTLDVAARLTPDLPRVALWDATTWKPGSQWLGPVSYQTVRGDAINGARQVASVLSPEFTPQVNRAFVARAHRLGLRVIPWTIDEAAAMNTAIDAGVDGIITDYPTRLRSVMVSRGMPLPTPIR